MGEQAKAERLKRTNTANGESRESATLHHVAADGISFAATFCQKSLLAHSVAAPLQLKPTLLGFELVVKLKDPPVADLLFCIKRGS